MKGVDAMGYQISYGQAGVKKRKKWNIPKPRIEKQKMMAALCVILSMLLVAVCVIPQFRTYLRDLILPGDPSVTAAALEEMVDAIGEGQSVQAALTEFCRDILRGA